MHVCLAGACTDRRAGVHADAALVAPASVGWRGPAHVYACHGHAHVHACVGGVACALTRALDDGYAACVYSGRVVAAPVEAAYSDAVAVYDAPLAAIRADIGEERRQRATALRPAERVVAAVLATPASATSGGDVDFPTRGLFPRSAALNTFGDDEDLTLLRCYVDAHAIVNRLLASPARAALVFKQRRDAYTNVANTLQTHIARRRAAGGVVSRATLRAIAARVQKRRRAYPLLVLPPHGRERLVAYYAMLCLELYFNLRHAARSSALVTTAKDRETIAALFPMDTFAGFMPSLLQRFATRCCLSTGAIVAYAEPLLALMPDEPTMTALGCASRTPYEKLMRVLLKCVANSPRELGARLRATHIDNADVLGAPPDTSIVRLFLERRRARLRT